MDFATFETRLLSVMAGLAIVAAALLLWSWLERRARRRAPFLSPAFRAAHVQPTQKAAPTVATILSSTVAERPRVSSNPTREWDRRTNFGMF